MATQMELACVASVSSRVIARKLERKQKTKMEGGGGGEKRKRLSANLTILENVPWHFTVQFISKLTARHIDNEQITRFEKFALFPKTRCTRLQNCNEKKLYDKKRSKL